MKYLLLLLCSITSVLIAPREPLGAQPLDGRPNFLIVRVDELRAASVGCYGDPHAMTPRLDALAADGIRYTRAISNQPVCAAHRTAFDTGLFTHATLNGDKLHPGDETIHDVLQNEGYHTFAVGKWHKTPDSMIPAFFNQLVPFGIIDGLTYHAGHEQLHKLTGQEAIYYVNGVPVTHSAQPWRPQTHVDLAIAQIDAAMARAQPFYGVVDLEPPHPPYGPIVGTQWDVFVPGQVPPLPNVPPAVAQQLAGKLAHYYSMILSVDDMLGQLIDHLELTGLLNRTVVIFTADHGAHMGAHGLTGESNDNKRTPYEEAIKVPLIVRDPALRKGVVSNKLISTVDFKPWILTRAGAPVDPTLHRYFHHPEGRLLMITDTSPAPTGGAWYGFLRADGVKYARTAAGPWILFDTVADPYELNNLVGIGDPREAELDALLDEAATLVGLTLPF